MILAASTQRTFGIVILAIVLIGFVLYLFFNLVAGRDEIGSEIELAPNRKPYYDDDVLETSRLDRVLLLGLALLGVIAVGLPVYWLAEPGRQANADAGFIRTFATRGGELFEENCTSCHGAGGNAGGASVALTDDSGDFVAQVTWTAPSLTSIMSRFSEDEIRFVLDYGRLAMPAWGGPGGGPMTSQQIEYLIEYIRSIQKPEEVIRDEVDQGVRDRAIEVLIAGETDYSVEVAGDEPFVAALAEVREAVFDAQQGLIEAQLLGDLEAIEEANVVLTEAQDALTATRAEFADDIEAVVDDYLTEITDPDSDNFADYGMLLFTNRADGGVYGCARCHTQGWSYSATETFGVDAEPIQDSYDQGGGWFGWALTDGQTVDQFQTPGSHSAFIDVGSDTGVPYGAGGQGSGKMPGFGARSDDDRGIVYPATLTDEQIDAIVAYERSL